MIKTPETVRFLHTRLRSIYTYMRILSPCAGARRVLVLGTFFSLTLRSPRNDAPCASGALAPPGDRVIALHDSVLKRVRVRRDGVLWPGAPYQ